MFNISLKQPKSIAGTLMFLGILTKIFAYSMIGTLPQEATDSLSVFGTLIFLPGFLVWLCFVTLSLIRNVQKLRW
jgi:hypothetical protein